MSWQHKQPGHYGAILLPNPKLLIANGFTGRTSPSRQIKRPEW
jgi:hypothetical protein